MKRSYHFHPKVLSSRQRQNLQRELIETSVLYVENFEKLMSVLDTPQHYEYARIEKFLNHREERIRKFYLAAVLLPP